MVKKRFFRIYSIILFGLFCGQETHAITILTTNVFRPWDINLRPPRWPNRNWQFTGYFETGLKSRGYNPESDAVNVMQLWQPTQDALAMLQGFPPNSPETRFFQNVLMSPQDDGIRGHFDVTGKFNLKISGGLAARYHLPHNITIAAFLPFYSMKLHDVVFTDLTQDLTAQDIIVKENLTDNFAAALQQIDPSLELTGWNRSGVGDFGFFASWIGSYPQAKPILKNVDLTTRLGITLPTGLRTNENQILSIPFGYNGSAGLWFGAGITLTWFDHVRAGIDFEFLHLFGNSRFQRIKTQIDQTDLLFLAKAYAHTDYGFTQQYNLYAEAYRFFSGLSVGAIYQFWRHGEDKLALYTNLFSNVIANTAQKLQEITIHQFIFKLNYDFQCNLDDCAPIKPNIFLFYKLPFNGTRALLVNTIGAVVTLNF